MNGKLRLFFLIRLRLFHLYTFTLFLSNYSHFIHNSFYQEVMEEERPWALVSEVGGEFGLLEDMADIIRQHFHIVCYKDFLQNPQLHAPRIQVLLMWKYYPEAELNLLRSLPFLKAVVSGGVGVDHMDVRSINDLGVKVANTPGVVSDATADLAVGLLLASARNILEGHQISVDKGTFRMPQSFMGVEVTGSTLGIIGMGEIGYKIAQRCKGFEMKILYHNRTKRSVEDERVVEANYCQSLSDLLRRSDFVLLAVKLTSDTSGLISHKELSLMKPSATLINISRGQVVDQEALVQALHTGSIRAAALDVTHPEPLPRDHPLLGLPNVLITPHIGISTVATAKRIVGCMVQNAVAAVKGLPLPNEVKMK
ncbi:glyoxylate/hydroxypyruvate reductase B-like [Dunckerocampus dactyliophorus]|uniref:glyoxylate/hydroxypyruvate reductase B-like n=1 Tax=Dunckerocampus dactyliophorus TaxID=161453 RepID=UPI0024063A92|nr:glyoxylate/hydroxypyruvate reductase B-like [Dunckerocampus dactyliophorus]